VNGKLVSIMSDNASWFDAGCWAMQGCWATIALQKERTAWRSEWISFLGRSMNVLRRWSKCTAGGTLDCPWF